MQQVLASMARQRREAGQPQRPPGARGMRLEHPAGELGQPRFHIEPVQRVVIKVMVAPAGTVILAHQQWLAARIGFPRHLPGRVALAEIAQPGQFIEPGLGALAPRFGGGAIRRAPGPLAGWTQSRFLPMKPKLSFRERWESLRRELADGDAGTNGKERTR